MPRVIPAEALNAIAQETGLEPINIIKVQWVKNGEYYYYADRAIQGEARFQGKLLTLADVEAVLNIDKSGTSTSVKVDLSDADGTIKAIFDYKDIHNRPVTIFQWFSHLSTNFAFPIFEGVIASPIVWSEDERVISFDVITKLEDREAGFSVEDGDFADVPEILLGKSWPMVFGTVLDMPTLQMDDMPSGTTLVDIGIPDASLQRQANYHEAQNDDQAGKSMCLSQKGAEMQWIGLSKKDRSMYERGQSLQRQAKDMLANANVNGLQSKRFESILMDQKQYDRKNIPIINGHLFRQNEQIEIEINGAHYIGRFLGDDFQVSSRRGPDEPVQREPETLNEVQNSAFPDIVIQDTQEMTDKQIANMIFGGPLINVPTGGFAESVGDVRTGEAESNAYWNCEPPYFIQVNLFHKPEDKVGSQNEGEFFFAAAGSSVNVGRQYPIRYILSITPGTQVLWLSAHKTVNGLKILTPIPPSYYAISTMALGSVSAVIATFNQPLSSMKTDTNDQDWEDDVYATLVSPIGPNVVNILIYLIQSYTEYGIDTVSFNYVRTRVANYPANFALLGKKNVVELLREIAWQSRCSIWISNGKFYIKYLPEQSGAVDDLTEDDVEQLRVTTTSTEDLVTKFIATWKANYAVDEPNKVILRYNINKYGTHEQTFDFYIYNSASLVVKSAVFWLIRMANIWKRIQCKVFLNKLKAETMDSITVNFARPFVATVPVVGIVEKATYNSEQFSIDMDVWLPVRLGEMVPYLFAYPADISVQHVFPTREDIAGGFTGDTPQQQGATGSLFSSSNKSNRNISPKSVGYASRTAQTHPSDQHSSNAPPVVSTTAGGNRYGSTPGSADSPALIFPGGRPGYDYVYRDSPRAPIMPEQPSPSRMYPGKITAKTGATLYTGEIYPKGLGGDAQKIEGIVVLKINPEDTIAPGTWGFILKQNETVDDKITIRYYFQPWIWNNAPASGGGSSGTGETSANEIGGPDGDTPE